MPRLARPEGLRAAGWKLTRAISEAVDPRTEWHVMRCERCAAEYRALQALAQDAKAAASVPETLSREARDEIGARLRTLVAATAAEPGGGSEPTRRGLIWAGAARCRRRHRDPLD